MRGIESSNILFEGRMEYCYLGDIGLGIGVAVYAWSKGDFDSVGSTTVKFIRFEGDSGSKVQGGI